MTNIENIKKLNKLYNANRFDVFVMAVTHLLDIGFRTALKITEEDINELEDNGLMTKEFVQNLVRLSKNIALACGNDLVLLIQFCNAKNLFEKIEA